MTFTDMLIGLITTVASVVTDLIFSKLPGNTFGQVALANAFKGLSPVSALAGFATSALTGNATLSGSIGLPFANVSVSFTPFPDAGSPSVVFGGALPFFRGDTTGAGQVSGIPVTL